MTRYAVMADGHGGEHRGHVVAIGVVGSPNGGDVVAWAMMPSCTRASLSAPIATPEKLLVARGASRSAPRRDPACMPDAAFQSPAVRGRGARVVGDEHVGQAGHGPVEPAEQGAVDRQLAPGEPAEAATSAVPSAIRRWASSLPDESLTPAIPSEASSMTSGGSRSMPTRVGTL